jgi:hypothetical protein
MFLLPVGSVEDWFIIVAVLLISRVTAVRLVFRRLQDRFGSDLFRFLLLNVFWIAGAWANARARLGRGPFHMVDVPGVWRGYPFMYEEWIVILNPSVKICREFHWIGLIADAALLVIASFCVIRRFSNSRGHIISVCIAVLSGIFVWLNVEPWVDGVPITALNWPHLGRSWVLTYGYPFKYNSPYPHEWHSWVLGADLALGCIAWGILFALSRYVKSSTT